MLDFTQKPFNLTKQQCAWVEKTFASMSIDEKVGQLFCPIGYSTEPAYLDNELLRWGIGGLFFRDGEGKEMRSTFEYAQNHSKIPLLIPSNLEAGGDGAATDGTAYGKQMSVAAAGNPIYAYRLGKIACSEASALGINWAFAPVVDIDKNYLNPITNVRTYGNNADTVIKNASEYLRAAKECNVATSVKHFPGDGVDMRDQHIVTSVNSLSVEEWKKSYGKVYQAMIDEGTLTVMVGHIAFPAYEEKCSGTKNKKIVPATLSKNLMTKLLREELGFNGLIVTDASPMVGFTSAEKREVAVPLSIECGADMFLFNKDLAEDFHFMKAGVENGILSKNRLDEAVKRILALKAALGLPEKKEENTLVPPESSLSILKSPEHKSWSRELADKSITLVKDTGNNLPLKSAKTRRILLEILGNFPSNTRVIKTVTSELEKRDFEVVLYQKEDFNSGVDNVQKFKEKYDAVLYIANIENASNKTTNRIDWYTFWGAGNNVPWFAHEVPVVFASVANPYHLLDVPMLETYINAYSNNDFMLKALIEKICGESKFNGISPIDPFCGREELAY